MIKQFDFTGVPQEDINKLEKEFLSKINYIASGARDRYIQREKLEEELKEWSRTFGKQLKEYGISNKNTSYSAWEYGFHGFTVALYYVLQDGVKTQDDFYVSVISYSPKFELLGRYKTVEEVIDVLFNNNLIKSKDKKEQA